MSLIDDSDDWLVNAALLEQASGEFGGLPNHLVRQLQRGHTRWERRKDPGAP